MGRIRYIGSKARIVEKILDHCGLPNGGWFLDVFSGTGVVSREAAIRGWRIRANDHLLSASILTIAKILSVDDVPFLEFGGYQNAIKDLNYALPRPGFIYKEYTPSGKSSSGIERRYFTCDNGKKIDGMRALIETWHGNGKLTDKERALLIADLLEASNSVANIAGTYGCFMRHWTETSMRPIVVLPRALLFKAITFRVSNFDAFIMKASKGDLVYMDPPYTKRQYAAYYHILETISVGDKPDVSGITGLRPWRSKSSPFCFKKSALKALLSLVVGVGADRVIISYNSEGHIDLTDLEAGLKKYGKVRVHELADVGRYRPNQKATTTGSYVTEFLVEWTRSQSLKDGELSLFS